MIISIKKKQQPKNLYRWWIVLELYIAELFEAVLESKQDLQNLGLLLLLGDGVVGFDAAKINLELWIIHMLLQPPQSGKSKARAGIRPARLMVLPPAAH